METESKQMEERLKAEEKHRKEETRDVFTTLHKKLERVYLATPVK
jgi:hypothetical protein